MKKIFFGCLILFFSATFSVARAHGMGNEKIKKSALLDMINQSAHYAITVLVDEEGKSRCDYNLTQSKWIPYEEPWHTGQLINALLESYRITGRKEYLDTAVKSGNWWIGLEIKGRPELEGMIKGIHGNIMSDNLIVFATISDGTPGLYYLSEVTGDKKYAQTATNAARWMLEHMYDASRGICYDNVDIRTGKVIKDSDEFEGNSTYTVRPNTEGYLFKQAYEFSGKKDFKDAYVTLCDSLVGFQTPEGLWMQFPPNNAKRGSFHPRYNLWNAESLLEAYELTKNKKYLESAVKTLRFYTRYQLDSGAMFYHAKLDGTIDKSSICSSEVAFAGILWMRLVGYGYPEFVKNYERSASWLMKAAFSPDHGDPNLRGALTEITTSVSNGSPKIINRDLGTIFALRFYAAYYDLKFGTKNK